MQHPLPSIDLRAPSPFAGEAHWTEEAKALLPGLTMSAVAHHDPVRKTLATARFNFQFSALRHALAAIFLVLSPNCLDACSR